jgi:Piezo non-specific cation channel, R-Ras-binding domain
MYTSTVFVLSTTIGTILSIKPETIWVQELPEAEQII